MQRDVVLSEEWIGTQYSTSPGPIPRMLHMGEWSTHASATNHTTRHDLARGLAKIVTEQEEIAAWRDCKKLVEKENLRGFTLRCRLL